MALPNNQLAATPVPSGYLAPDAHARVNTLYDYERGGWALNDASEGLLGYDWKVWVEGDDILLARAPYDSPTTLFTAAGTTWVSLAFDQNMRPNVAYMQAGACKLWWYDTTIPGATTTTFADCASPMLCLDDKRQGADSYNDVLFFYVRAGSIRYRQQRDRYGTERNLTAVPDGTILQVGMAQNLRVQIRYHREDTA
jgi:hypothetical protein